MKPPSRRHLRRLAGAAVLALMVGALWWGTTRHKPYLIVALPAEIAVFSVICDGGAYLLVRQDSEGFVDGRRLTAGVHREPQMVSRRSGATFLFEENRLDASGGPAVHFRGFAAGIGQPATRPDRGIAWLWIPPWVPLGLLGAYLLWHAAGLGWSLRRVAEPDACRHCGYLLRGLPTTSDRCPECGGPVLPEVTS